MPRFVRVMAPAKINLFLGVGQHRDDGFHDVVTVLHALDFGDTVTVMPAERIEVTVSPDIGVAPSDNLAFKAVVRLAEQLGTPRDLGVRIEKRVPFGAGLGGGSSDAAAVIRGVCHLAGISTDREDVLGVARSLGADVPFFLAGPAALMGGRGDALIRRLPPVRMPVVLIKPPSLVPTGEAYRRFDLHPAQAGTVDALVASLEAGYLDPATLSNNLESAAVAVVPATGDALAWAAATHGVVAAHVSGSGSAVFAIFEDAEAARRTADSASAEGWWALATRTASEGVAVIETGDSE